MRLLYCLEVFGIVLMRRLLLQLVFRQGGECRCNLHYAVESILLYNTP